MGRAERSTTGKLEAVVVDVVVDVTVLEDVPGLTVADVAASEVSGPPTLLQEARRMATNTARRIARDYVRSGFPAARICVRLA